MSLKEKPMLDFYGSLEWFNGEYSVKNVNIEFV
jgi:hypothetical protein